MSTSLTGAVATTAAAIALAAGAAATKSETATANPSGRLVCFDRGIWSADDGARPCARVLIFEDASMRVTTGTANGARAYWSCTLPAVDGGKPRCVRAE